PGDLAEPGVGGHGPRILGHRVVDGHPLEVDARQRLDQRDVTRAEHADQVSAAEHREVPDSPLPHPSVRAREGLFVADRVRLGGHPRADGLVRAHCSHSSAIAVVVTSAVARQDLPRARCDGEHSSGRKLTPDSSDHVAGLTIPIQVEYKGSGMDDLLAARSQMAMSLAFHILFAIAGMAMPLLMVLAERLHQRNGYPAALDLAKRWARGTAILFAVGAVSGTVLSFELGLLWPEFMRHAGPLVGMPFSLEGFAFFLEAIFLGLYLYGWQRLSPRVHLATGIGVAACGLLSAIFVTSVNAWMNEPTGFDFVDGEFTRIRPWRAMFNDAFFSQALHVSLSAYVAVAFVVMGIHAWALRRNPTSALHRTAFRLALGLALVSTPAQIVSGDLSSKHIARHQPVKLAAAEGLFETQ